MNTKNNKRRRQSVEKIEKAFMELLQTAELKDVSVSAICKLAEINRSTFYANFEDVYALADFIRDRLESDFSSVFIDYENFDENSGALKLFTHIKENQLFYKTYFKLGYENKQQLMRYDKHRAETDFSNKHIDYHIEFFRNGLNAIIKLWLERGCAESPEDMAEIITQEYRGR